MSVADPALEIQKAVNQHLRATPAVASLVSVYNGGPAIFDQPPADAVLPYICSGPSDMLPDTGDCIDGATLTMQVDAFAGNNVPGVAAMVRIRQIGKAVAAALDEATLTLDAPQHLVEMTLERTQYLREPDGITAHAVISIIANTEPRD